MVLFQVERLVLGLVFGLLEIVLFDAQQSEDGIEDIERAKGNSFDTLLAAVLPSLLLKCRSVMNGFRGRSIVTRSCKYAQLHATYYALLFSYYVQRTLQGRSQLHATVNRALAIAH
jgi:hypothetical protein